MAHLLRVQDVNAELCTKNSMRDKKLTEPMHLEAWIIQHPEVLDDTLKVVSSQFNRWASTAETAQERLDVLALATSGELVVIELKRDGDRRVHLQALTYGALVAGFTRDDLATVHAEWLTNKRETPTTHDEALSQLDNHVQGEWSDDLLHLPRLMLVAENFPPQVLTTIQWLQDVAPNLTIECHEYQLFTSDESTFVSFQRLVPVENIDDRVLRPSVGTTQAVRTKLDTNQRRAKSVTVIEEQGCIPEGAPITLELDTLVKPSVAQQVNEWLDAEPNRRRVTWTRDSNRPLVWGTRPDHVWTPSSLRNEIFIQAGLATPSFSAADAWCYNGKSLYWVAEDTLGHISADSKDTTKGAESGILGP